MSTERQIAANQANSQKSTGPKTESGKAAASRNHLSHGFASSTLYLLPGEDPAEFKALTTDLLDEHKPATPTEQILVEKMAINQWLSLRSIRLQTTAFFNVFDQTGANGIPKELALLIRYQTAADRAFHKAHAELLKVQKQRRDSQIGFEPQEIAEPAAESSEMLDPTPQTTPLTLVSTANSADFHFVTT